jgi:N-methylhydantoinase A
MANIVKSGTHIVGIDVGGTFTDILCYNAATRALLSAKVPSVPGSQWRGVLEALHALGIDLSSIFAFVHGTTIATNTVLERKGAKTGLLTTEGFRDVIEIGLTRRLVGGLFDIKFVRQVPLIDRSLRLEAPERVAADGTVLRDINGFDYAAVAEGFKRADVTSVAICFVNSYKNDCNEAKAGEALRRLLPGVPVTESAILLPEKGEFGRFSTCVLNAYLTPRIVDYLKTLTAALADKGVEAPVSIMTSNGGAMTLERAAKTAVSTFLSGPVGGVNGTIRICEMTDTPNCITFDMGGTSTDVALIHNRMARTSHDNQHEAFPHAWPQLDIHTIGAGGGSIISAQPDGTLEVGPQSAGAIPGPACYLRGGMLPTISDANLLLGRLPFERAISGGLKLSIEAAHTAMAGLAKQIGRDEKDVQALAESALRIAVAKMAGAVREVSVHRGHDPRDFVLFGFGGAGPMHLLPVADELYLPRAMIPPMPGHLSAFGQMLADHRRDYVAVWEGIANKSKFTDLKKRVSDLRAQAAAQLKEDGFKSVKQRFNFGVDMRYAGQSFTLSIPWQENNESWEPLISGFRARHEETFGYADAKNEIQVTAIRLVALGLVEKINIAFPLGEGKSVVVETRPVWFDGEEHDCKVYDRTKMNAGYVLEGPAIIEEPGCTSIVPPKWRVTVLPSSALDCVSLRDA